MSRNGFRPYPLIPTTVELQQKMISDANFVLGNAQIPEQYPIVYCSDGFCDLTGLGRTKVSLKNAILDF